MTTVGYGDMTYVLLSHICDIQHQKEKAEQHVSHCQLPVPFEDLTRPISPLFSVFANTHDNICKKPYESGDGGAQMLECTDQLKVTQRDKALSYLQSYPGIAD